MTTGFMYTKVILKLRDGASNNARKKSLSIAFFALWFSWVVLTTPYAVFEFCAFFIPNFFNVRESFSGIIENIVHHNYERILVPMLTWATVSLGKFESEQRVYEWKKHFWFCPGIRIKVILFFI